MSVKDVLDLVKKNKVEIVDFKFVDVPGLWQHFSIPAAELTADLFEDGIGFDGSSIRGFQSINESDMLLIPDPDSAMMDPFTEHVTLSLICNVIDAVTRESYSRDPRYVAQKAEKYLKSTGIADISYRWTSTRTCAPRWSRTSSSAGSRSKCTITKWAPPGRPRLT